jgi:hypothetical protein
VPSTDSWPSQRAVHVSHDLLDDIAAQPLIAVTDEDQIGLRPATLCKPIAQHDGIFADRCGPLLAPFTYALHMRSSAQHDIAAGQVDQFRDAQPALKGLRLPAYPPMR